MNLGEVGANFLPDMIRAEEVVFVDVLVCPEEAGAVEDDMCSTSNRLAHLIGSPAEFA